MKRPKRILFLLLTATALPAAAYAWGGLFHRAVAEAAQRNLSPKAIAEIERYTQGTPLAAYATFMDEVVADPRYKEPFAGWHASIADSTCRSPVEVRQRYRNSRDGVTAAEWITEELKNYRSLDDSVVLTYIKCLVHIIPDFHCPAHVRYTDAHNEGKFDVTFFGRKILLHSIWDHHLLTRLRPGWDDMRWADYLCETPRKEIRAAKRGSYREWFEDTARDVRISIDWVRPGDALGDEFMEKAAPLADKELRKAAARLTKTLERIFGK